MNVKKTREAILDNSIIIFNEKKPSKVSTVQIADQMGISPGNLYYYFGNKEEIIRCIWRERIQKDIKNAFSVHEQVLTGADIVRMFSSTISHIRSYKFFYSEISTLLNNDNVLRDEMKSSMILNKKRLFDFIEMLIDKGLLKPLSNEEKFVVADVICAIAGKAFYSNYAYSFYDEIGDEIIGMLLVNIFMGIKPYITENSWEGIIGELSSLGIEYDSDAEKLRSQYAL